MTEQVKLESICPSCGKTDKLLWPEGCKNTWHIEGRGAMSEIQRYFFEPTMRISNATLAPTVAAIKDGSGTFVLYADHAAALRERDERIAALEAENAELVRKHNEQFKAAAQLAEVVVKLNAENARLSAPVTDAVMEELAAMEHERWSSQAIAALTDMTDARRERWTRQARLLYVGLTDAEKEQDRQQVRKTLTILAARKGAA